MTIRYERLCLALLLILLMCVGLRFLGDAIRHAVSTCVAALDGLNDLVFDGSGADHYRLAVLCVLLITLVALAKLLLRRGPTDAGSS